MQKIKKITPQTQMANNDYVVRLTGDSKGLNNAVKSAQTALNDLGKQNQSLDSIKDRFEKISKSTAPLNRKIRDIKKTMEDLAVSGATATTEGKEMWQKLANEAKKYDEISIQEIIDKKLMAVDLTASIMCLENKMPMLVFGLNEENSIVETMSGNFNGTKVTV